MIDREKLLLYAITDRSYLGKMTLSEQAEEALKGGVTCLQLREKALPDDELLAEAEEIKGLCRAYGALFIINDRADIALLIGADGVHVGAEDEAVASVRKKAGPDFIIGATAKTIEEARAAERAGADYLGVGAVFPSPTKQNARRITPEKLREICAAVKIPAVAIGGITAENIREIYGSGIAGAAVISAVFGAEDIKKAARELKVLAAEAAKMPPK
ncbi:MAG: thiamine phosphate synthase [Oscillospiraceae bacterium]|nr:thiamine phosphate synthase [Oscillospiraceae bacterium]